MGNKRNREKTRRRTFGKAGGRYSFSVRKQKEKQHEKLCAILRNSKRKPMSIQKRKGLKVTFGKLCVDRAKKYICSTKKDTINITLNACEDKLLSGSRIINLEMLRKHVSEITVHTALCENARGVAIAGKDPVILTSEKRNGFSVIISAKCQGCGEIFLLKNSENISTESGTHIDINVRAVWGNMVTGGGCSSLNESMGTMGVPGLQERQYSKIEQQIGDWWSAVLEEDMKEAGQEERQNAIDNNSYFQGVPAITVVCDGGWCKRSHKHTYNAMAGVGVIFGLHTKKLLHLGVRNKMCYICSAAEEKNIIPRQHTCFRNWSDSAQSMETDIILEGFRKSEQQHGVRYMNFIGDGDSSVYSTIVEHVPEWGPYVKKLECANHACKCLRTHLEQLVVDKPAYKGKGKLTALSRKRIIQGVRAAIKMRSKEKNRKTAVKELMSDIQNCGKQVLGIHDHCSTDFCKKKHAITTEEKNSIEEEDVAGDEDVIKETCDIWLDTMTDLSSEELTSIRQGGVCSKAASVSEDLLKDLFFILNRMSFKADRLIGNFTSNLAESWMNVRCKFDGGKMTNRCFRGSFLARCYGGGLRATQGPAWSPVVYSKITGKTADPIFLDVYRKRTRKYVTTLHKQQKDEEKTKRFKRKMKSVSGNKKKKAKLAYGPGVLCDEPDLPQGELDKQCEHFYRNNVECNTEDRKVNKIETTGQSNKPKWKEERRKRVTSSSFGDIMTRKANNDSTKLTQRLLYSNFEGNCFTRKGLMEEENARKEYIQLKNKTAMQYLM